MKGLLIALICIAACSKHNTSQEGSHGSAGGSAATRPQGFTGREDMASFPGGTMNVHSPACVPGTLETVPQGSGSVAVNVAAFAIDREVVSCDALQRCESAHACSTGDDQSYCHGGAALASFDEARQYCAWRSAVLPTVAEWQRAARGTDGKTFPWGSVWKAPDCDQGTAGDSKRCIYETDGFKFEAGSNPYEWTSDEDCGQDLRFKKRALPLIVALGAFRLDETRTTDPSAGAGEFRCARQVLATPK